MENLTKMTLEEAKKLIKANEAFCHSECNHRGKRAFEVCTEILAKVETPESDEEGRAVLWLIDEGCSVGKEDGRYQVFSKPTPSGMRHFLGEHPVTEAKKLGWGG